MNSTLGMLEPMSNHNLFVEYFERYRPRERHDVIQLLPVSGRSRCEHDRILKLDSRHLDAQRGRGRAHWATALTRR